VKEKKNAKLASERRIFDPAQETVEKKSLSKKKEVGLSEVRQ